MNQSQRWPERMIASKNEAVRSAAANCSHPAPVGFDPRGARVVKVSAMDCAPEVCVELEVGTAPIMTHCAEHLFKMKPRFRVRSVENVPGAVPPTAERYSIRAQRLSFRILYKPIRMLRE